MSSGGNDKAESDMNKENLEERFSQLRFLNKGLISSRETAANLEISTRQVQRLLKRMKIITGIPMPSCLILTGAGTKDLN